MKSSHSRLKSSQLLSSAHSTTALFPRRQHTTAWAVQHRLQVDVRIEEQKVGGEWDRVEVGGRERVARVGGDARLVGLLQLYPHRLVEVDLWVQCQSARKGICNTWKKKAVCMASSWVSMRENRCARQVGGRLGREPVRNAGQVDRRPRQRGASDEHRAMRVAHLSLQKFSEQA